MIDEPAPSASEPRLTPRLPTGFYPHLTDASAPQQQAEIRKMVSKGRKTAADAARLFNVHPTTVSRLLRIPAMPITDSDLMAYHAEAIGIRQSFCCPACFSIPFLAHRFAFQFDAMRIVHEPVQNAVGDGGIADLDNSESYTFDGASPISYCIYDKGRYHILIA